MRSTAFVVFALVGSACASAPSPEVAAGGGATEQSAPANHNRDIITRDELTRPAVANMTVLDAVRSLRPHFLTVRGQTSLNAKRGNDPEGQLISDSEAGKVHASIDGAKIVPVQELSGLRAGSVIEVRLLSPAAAMQRFGSTARQGPVILVKTM